MSSIELPSRRFVLIVLPTSTLNKKNVFSSPDPHNPSVYCSFACVPEVLLRAWAIVCRTRESLKRRAECCRHRDVRILQEEDWVDALPTNPRLFECLQNQGLL